MHCSNKALFRGLIVASTSSGSSEVEEDCSSNTDVLFVAYNFNRFSRDHKQERDFVC
jgi:hypothetical protein